MTRIDVLGVLEYKVNDMSMEVKSIREAVCMDDKQAIDSAVSRLEREIDAFKRLANGANLGQKEETK